MRTLTAFALLSAAVLALPAARAAEPAAEPPAELDPIEVSAAVKRELLVQIVQLGLERGRSDKREDLDRIACVRDKKPGTRFAAIRCATNRDWQTVANISYSRANVGTTAAAMSGGGGYCGPHTNTFHQRMKAAGVADSIDGGVITVSTRLLLGASDDKLDAGQRTARIHELMGRLALADRGGAAGDDPAELTRFATLFDTVQNQPDDAAAERAILDAGFTLERYNALVARMEQDAVFAEHVLRLGLAAAIAVSL